jgi:hypothetical protein
VTQYGQQRIQQAGVFYAEDRSAIRWPCYFHLVIWPLLLISLIAAEATFGNADWSFLMAVATCGTLLATTFALKNWPVGIRIGGDGIRIGAVRRQPKPGKQPWADYQRWQTLFVPWNAVRRAAVITDKSGLRDARLLSKRNITKVGVLTAPFTRAALLIEVDPDRVVVPEFHEPHERRPMWTLGHMTPFELSPVWYVPTRHPAELRSVLAQHAAFFGGSTSPRLPSYLGLLLERGDVTSQLTPR